MLKELSPCQINVGNPARILQIEKCIIIYLNKVNYFQIQPIPQLDNLIGRKYYLLQYGHLPPVTYPPVPSRGFKMTTQASQTDQPNLWFPFPCRQSRSSPLEITGPFSESLHQTNIYYTLSVCPDCQKLRTLSRDCPWQLVIQTFRKIITMQHDQGSIIKWKYR